MTTMSKPERFSDGRPVPENPGFDTVLHTEDAYALTQVVLFELAELSSTITQVMQEARDYIATSPIAS